MNLKTGYISKFELYFTCGTVVMSEMEHTKFVEH